MSYPVLGHGFSTSTALDHRAWIWVAGLLSLIYSVLCLAARFTGKYGLLWWDDLILCLGYASALTHWGFLFQSISDGLAVSSLELSATAMGRASRNYFAARIPFFVAHCLAKLSILVFTRRIFAGDIYKESVFFGISYGFTAIYGILAVLLSSAGCNPSEALVASTNAVCSSNTARWAVLTAFDAFTELIILAMPIWFISKNQLKASKKRIVIFVYSFRLIVLAFTIATTSTYLNFLSNGRSNIDIAPVVAWQEVLLGFSLISSSFPCLRSFIWAFMSRGLLTMYGNTTISSSQLGSRGASMHMRSLNKSHGASRQGSETGESRCRLRPEQVTYRVDVRGANGSEINVEQPNSTRSASGNGTKASDDSDRGMIIHQETSYRVESVTV